MKKNNFSNWLLLNIYLTQALLLMIALGLLWFQGRLTWDLFSWGNREPWVAGLMVGLGFVGLNVALTWFLPHKWLDEGGINEALFYNRSVFHIGVIALLVSLAEELLFRGAIQYWLGVLGTSLLFTLIHFRYLRRWLMVTLLFLVSLGLGFITDYYQSLLPAVIAHFTVDFILGIFIRYRILKKVE